MLTPEFKPIDPDFKWNQSIFSASVMFFLSRRAFS